MTLTSNRHVELPSQLAEHLARKAEQERVAKRTTNIAEHQHIRRLLRDLRITVFDDYSALAIGIRHALIELPAGEVEPAAISRFLCRHTTRFRYLDALARSEPRRDLNGIETKPPTDEHRDSAAQPLAKIVERKAKREAAAIAGEALP